MQLNEQDRERWQGMTAFAKQMENLDPHLKLKTEFRMSDPEVKEWALQVLAPSLLDGDAGVASCLASVDAEKDDVVKALKIALIAQWWGSFEAKTPAAAAEYLATHGLDKDVLRHVVLDTHYPEAPSEEYLQGIRETIAEENGVDPDDVLVEFVGGEAPTYH